MTKNVMPYKNQKDDLRVRLNKMKKIRKTKYNRKDVGNVKMQLLNITMKMCREKKNV